MSVTQTTNVNVSTTGPTSPQVVDTASTVPANTVSNTGGSSHIDSQPSTLGRLRRVWQLAETKAREAVQGVQETVRAEAAGLEGAVSMTVGEYRKSREEGRSIPEAISAVTSHLNQKVHDAVRKESTGTQAAIGSSMAFVQGVANIPAAVEHLTDVAVKRSVNRRITATRATVEILGEQAVNTARYLAGEAKDIAQNGFGSGDAYEKASRLTADLMAAEALASAASAVTRGGKVLTKTHVTSKKVSVPLPSIALDVSDAGTAAWRFEMTTVQVTVPVMSIQATQLGAAASTGVLAMTRTGGGGYDDRSAHVPERVRRMDPVEAQETVQGLDALDDLIKDVDRQVVAANKKTHIPREGNRLPQNQAPIEVNSTPLGQKQTLETLQVNLRGARDAWKTATQSSGAAQARLSSAFGGEFGPHLLDSLRRVRQSLKNLNQDWPGVLGSPEALGQLEVTLRKLIGS